MRQGDGAQLRRYRGRSARFQDGDGNRMTRRLFGLVICFTIAAICTINGRQLLRADGGVAVGSGTANAAAAQDSVHSNALSESLARSLGIEFVKGSTSTLIVQREGKKYEVNLATRTIREIDPPSKTSLSAQAQSATHSAFAGKQPEGAVVFKRNCSTCHGPQGKGLASIKTPDFTNLRVQASISDAQMLKIILNGKPGTMMPAFGAKLSPGQIAAVQSFLRSLNPGKQSAGGTSPEASTKRKNKIYTPGDDVLFTLPTGRPLDRHGLYMNFSHRFPYDPAFSGPARGGALFGLDGFAIPSFGLRYGVTDRLSVGVYREPSILGRPIQFTAGYNLLEEQKGNPLNLAIAIAMQGQNDFLKNYTESIEGILSRSVTSRAQLYLVPTYSLNNRELQQVNGYRSRDILDLPGHDTFSLGIGGALDIRPTVALIAEVTPTLVNGRPLGILRPAYSFGIQKKIWRHAFTFGFTTAPGRTVAERAATRASFLGQPNADTPSGLFIGFDLTRQLF